MYVIGALKKTGKSRFSIFLSLKLHEQGAGVMWNSLEMNDLQLNSCALAYYADIDARYIGRRMPDQEFVKLNGSLGKLNDLNWMISREKNVFDLRARIIQLRSTRTVDVVFVDYIQRMEDSNYSKDRTRETEALSKGLADLSRDLNVAIVVLSQLAGRAENLGKDEMPNMSHMKESQGIAEAADCIITLHNFARRDNPVNADGSYKLAEIYALIEQRYDVSGCRFRFLGDLRTCNFLNHVDPYGEPNV